MRKEVHLRALLFDLMDTFEFVKNPVSQINPFLMSLVISRYFLLIPSLLLLFSCSKKEEETLKLFELMEKEKTGIDFNNNLDYNEKFNPYLFRNFYNGAGVALGDINNDGLVDVFLSGNQQENPIFT